MKKQTGVTLVELIISVAILGVIMMVIPIALRVLNSISYQQKSVQSTQQIQAFFYILAKDIRNAPRFDLDYDSAKVKTEYANYLDPLKVIFEDPSHGPPPHAGEYIILRTIDERFYTTPGQDENPDLLDPQFWGVTVYYLKRTNDQPPCMTRRVFFNAPTPRVIPPYPGLPARNNLGGFREEISYFKGEIVPPTAGENVFNTVPDPSGAGTKRDSVRVEIKLGTPFRSKNKPSEVRRYSEEMSRWSSCWD